jgi:hypothetical protein
MVRRKGSCGSKGLLFLFRLVVEPFPYIGRLGAGRMRSLLPFRATPRRVAIPLEDNMANRVVAQRPQVV